MEALACRTAYIEGRIVRVAKVETMRPPITARPRGAAWEPPSLAPIAIGTMPKIIAVAVISTARRRPRLNRRRTAGPAGTLDYGVVERSAFTAQTFSETDQKNRVGDGDTDRHNRAHERLNVEGSRRKCEHEQHTTQYGRNGQDNS